MPNFLRTFLAPALLGALAVAGYAPFGWFPVPILTLAVLFRLVSDAAPRSALLAGWSYGLGLFLAGVSWIYVSISVYGGMPAPIAALATLLFCAFIALFPAAALWLGARVASAPVPRLALAFPAAWALLEWVRGWIFTGFPWLALGYSQAPNGAGPASPLAGFAPVLGVYGVSLVAVLSAGMLALLLPFPDGRGDRGEGARAASRWRVFPLPQPLPQRERGVAVAGLTGLLALIWISGWGLGQVAWTRPVEGPVSVALLQGNIPQDLKFRPERLQATLVHYARQVLASDARLIVLPETALPLFRSAVPKDYLEMLADHARGQGGDVVLGVPEDVGPERYFNSVISLGSTSEGLYRKHHLVPFGEFVPLGFRWALDLMSIPLGDFARGTVDQPPMAAGGQRLAVNVCYEDAFGEERNHAARDATLLVNLSNDAWFGASLAPWQHLQIGAMRSLEAARWQLRANNTGITAILDDKGRVRDRLEPFTSGTLAGTAQGRSGDTPYLVWGNLPALIIMAALLLAAGHSSRSPGRPKNDLAPSGSGLARKAKPGAKPTRKSKP